MCSVLLPTVSLLLPQRRQFNAGTQSKAYFYTYKYNSAWRNACMSLCPNGIRSRRLTDLSRLGLSDHCVWPSFMHSVLRFGTCILDVFMRHCQVGLNVIQVRSVFTHLWYSASVAFGCILKFYGNVRVTLPAFVSGLNKLYYSTH
jgi:hypothetical protein